MKLALIGITFMLYALVSTMAHANERPLLGKYNYPGYVPDEYNIVEECEVFASGHILKSIIRYQDGKKAVTTETFPLHAPVTEIQRLIEMAAREHQEIRDMDLCDAPSTVINAYGSLEIGAKGVLTLFSTGGCGSKREEVQGPAANALREILDVHCPRTIDINE